MHLNVFKKNKNLHQPGIESGPPALNAGIFHVPLYRQCGSREDINLFFDNLAMISLFIPSDLLSDSVRGDNQHCRMMANVQRKSDHLREKKVVHM